MTPVAIVTGASRGIGRAIARRLAPDYEIIALARSRGELESLAQEIQDAGGRCRPLSMDITDREAVRRGLDGIEADVLINNAGLGVMKPFLDLSWDDWTKMVDLNFNALFHVTKAVLPGMVERGRGHIVVIGSIAGRSAFVGGTCYGATKWAVMGFTESLMLEVRDAGVKVSMVAPGSVATDFFPPGRETSWMLEPGDVAESVAHVLATPPDVLVHRLEIRALSPKKG